MTQQTLDGLKSLLRRDEGDLEKLTGVLATEHQALAGNDMTALEQATNEKDELLKAVRERARRKIRLLAQLGYSPDSGESPGTFLERVCADAGLIEQWHSTRKRLEHCQHRNSVNGRILGHLQRRLARISDIIRGADRNQSLYGSGGEAHSLNPRHVLASA